MSAPRTIGEYLDELDDALKVGLNRRQRILTEAHTHLEEAAGAHQAHGASRQEAERLALSAFGSPYEVARGSDAATTLGRTVEVVADLCYRAGVRSRGVALFLLAMLAVTVVVFAAVGGSWLEGLLFSVLLLLMNLVKFGPEALSMPRPGYARRWLKLDRPARTLVLRSLCERRALSDPEGVEFAGEVAQRVRWLAAARWVLTLATAYFASVAVFFMLRGSAGLAALLGFAGVLCVVFAKRRSPRQRAEDELRVLDVVDQVVREAGAHARLQEGDDIDGTYPESNGDVHFWLVPTDDDAVAVAHAAAGDDDAVAVALAADGKVITLRMDHFKQKLRGPNRLRELRLCLAALVAGRCWEEAREVLISRRLLLRPRRYLETTLVIKTEDGHRRLRRRYRCGLEEFREALEQHGLSDHPETPLYRDYAPYPLRV